MKKIFGRVFINQETLKIAGINYPIKLEYYKRINEEELCDKNKVKYGVSIVKTEYREKKTEVEEKAIKYLTNDETKVDSILSLLKENLVTPVGLDDVIFDVAKTQIFANGLF